MRRTLTLAIMAALAASAAQAAETLPLNAVNQANKVIDATIEAYGGADKLKGLKTVTRKSTFTTWANNQSLKPEAPWDETQQSNFAAIDLENKLFVGRNAGSGGGFDFNGAQVIKGDEGWNIDYRAGTVTTMPQPDFNTTSGPLIRVTAPLLVKQLMERRQTSHWLGEVQFDGRAHDVITLVMEVGPALSLYIDQDSHMISRSERVLPPFGQVDYRFSNYQPIDGIPFATDFKLYVNDEPNLYVDYDYTRVNQPIEALTAIPQELQLVEGVAQPTEVELQEFAEGVWLVGAQGTYAMFVDMGDHLLAVGGTAGIPDRIRKLRETGVDKPITQAVLTHHHNDHLMGVPAWEEEGAVIYTVAAHEKVVRGTAKEGAALKLELVDGRKRFESGGRTVEVLDIGPTPHSEHLLVAYLPDEGVLFEADHFPNPASGPMPPAQPVTLRLAEDIDELGLDVKVIVGAHSQRVASIEDLRRSLAHKPQQAVTASL
jgi:glyoxylase-like metal-dependent hydrolase (beta-lactamase superfamily II)